MLSKSDLIHKYLDCPCALWVAKKHPELLPPTPDNLQRIFDQGHEVDELAKKLYPNGFEVRGLVRDGWKNTVEALKSRSDVLFQPTAISGDIHCRADILTRNRTSGVWDIREVKSSASVKEDHLFDLAFQRICFEGAGVKIGKTYLVHLDRDFVKRGPIDPQELFAQEDVSAGVKEAMPMIRERIGEAMEVLAWDKTPGLKNVAACTDPQNCEWLGLYLHLLPDDLRKRYERLRAPHPLPDPPIVEIDPVGIRRALRSLEYPAHFLDYETYMSALPLFDGYSPFDMVTFQYSMHVQDEPGGKTTHHEYLEREFTDPAPRLAAHLRERCGKDGSFVAWYALFEKGRNKEMGERVPEFAEFFADVNKRMYDPLYVFKKNRGLYSHSGFQGSASLKKVLPALVPSLSYKKLAIQEGETASNSWPTLISTKTPPERKTQLAKDMLAYCGLDTLGMVKIVDHLQEVAE